MWKSPEEHSARPRRLRSPIRDIREFSSRPSSLQEVFNNAPELVGRLLIIGDRLGSLLDDKNRATISQTLDNIRDTTGVLAGRSKDIDQLITNGGITLRESRRRQYVAEGRGGQSRTLFRQRRPAYRVRSRRIRPCDEACVRSRCSGASRSARVARAHHQWHSAIERTFGRRTPLGYQPESRLDGAGARSKPASAGRSSRRL